MNTRAALVLSLAFLCGAQGTYAQSFKDRLKSATEKVGQHVREGVERQTAEKKSPSSSDPKSEKNGTVRKSRTSAAEAYNKNAEDEAPTVRLPETHTALFAPLGYPIEARFGVKTAKPVAPPKREADQVNWVEKLPAVADLDNKSLVEEYLMLDRYAQDGYFSTLSPAYFRYSEHVKGEIGGRAGALNEMVKLYNEAIEEYGMDESYNWVVNNIHNKLAGVLDSQAYKTVIRSSLVPLFTLKDDFINEKTKEYFKAHGGYEGAEKATLTVWDPNPNKQSVSTTVVGQTGKIIDESASGATIDIGGVIYILHNKNGRPLKAFISEAVKTAVSGKDIEIPDYVIYKGGKYPVWQMRGDIFRDIPIKSVKLPSTLKEISNAAFRGTPITEITIPASVKIVQGSAFYGCTELTSVTFEGDSMDELHGCFQRCSALKSIRFPRRVGKMSYDMFVECTSLTDVTLPENMTEVYDHMFSGCKNLKKIDIPATVVKLGDGAFSGSGITEIDISSVTEFGFGCFGGCKALKTVRLNSSLKDNFLMEIYEQFMECPLLEVKYVNGQYVFPAGFIFVDR